MTHHCNRGGFQKRHCHGMAHPGPMQGECHPMMFRHGMMCPPGMPPMMGPPMAGHPCCQPGFGGAEGGRPRWMKFAGGKPVLTYFDAIGFAEQIRFCFMIGDIPFVDRRITMEEWTKHYSAYSPSGRAPFLEVDGKVLVESQAILHYAARQGGLMPETAEQGLKAAMIVEMMESEVAETSMKMAHIEDLEMKKKIMVESIKENHGSWCDKYEKMMKPVEGGEEGDRWALGKKMTYVDVYVAASLYRAQEMAGTNVIPNEEKYPALSKIYRGVMEHPRIAAYMVSKKQKAQKMVLYHFGFPGPVSSIMWAMKIGKIDFESKVVSKEEWEAGFKAQSPSGKLPMLEVNGEKYVETLAIMQYIAERAGLMPERDYGAARALSIAKLCMEFRDMMMAVKHTDDPEMKKTMIEKAVAVKIPQTIARIEEVLGQHQDEEGHVVGKRLSYADLMVAQIFTMMRRVAHFGIKITNLETLAPKMFKTSRMVRNIPAIQEHKCKKMIEVKPVLTYFDFSGRAEAPRYAMQMAGIEFEDRRITREDWVNIYKAMSPTGQCPFLSVGKGQTIVEAKAIMQWVVEVAPQLKPTHFMGNVVAEQLVSSWSRIHSAWGKYYEVPEAERADAVPRIRDQIMAPVLALEERLWADSKTHEGYSVGDKLTWVDAYLAGELEYMRDRAMLADNWQKTYPTLAAVYHRVTTHPNVAAYRAGLKK